MQSATLSAAQDLSPDGFDRIRMPLATDLGELDRRIIDCLQSDVPLVNQVGFHIIGGGGKRFRPLLLILVARALGYRGTAHIDLAMVVEFIHTATLLHDDVVDHAETRRGRKAAHCIWGNEASVLVGDFLYSRAFQVMASLHRHEVMDILADATNVIASGEVMQLMYCRNLETTEAHYFEIARRKTATLFAVAAELGAVAAGQDAARPRWNRVGHHVGMAFQLIDDVLDYSAPAERLGKTVGSDLAEGKPTLPLIRALAVSEGARREALEAAIQSRGASGLDAVLSAIRETDALDYTRLRAEHEARSARSAIESLESTVYAQALGQLIDFSVQRVF
jgi:octaprenyl-diphosphate synthase